MAGDQNLWLNYSGNISDENGIVKEKQGVLSSQDPYCAVIPIICGRSPIIPDQALSTSKEEGEEGMFLSLTQNGFCM